MKFGRTLSRNQVPEWASAYIRYKELKKLIGKAADSERQGQLLDTAEFFYSLDRNLEDVEFFYNRKYADATRRLKLLHDQYDKALDNPAELDPDQIEDLVEGLLELRGNLRKLQWYGDVNRRGFFKITKKLDKKVPQHTTRSYVESRVDTKAFASNADLGNIINDVNNWLSKAAEVKKPDAGSAEVPAQALPRVSAKAVLAMPRDTLDKIDQCVRNDDSINLMTLLRDANAAVHDESKDILYQRLLLNLLQRAVTCRSKQCIAELLRNIQTLEEGDDFNQRNILHRYVLNYARVREHLNSPSASPQYVFADDNYITPAAAPLLSVPSRSTEEVGGSETYSHGDKAIYLFEFILDHLSDRQKPALAAIDNSERMPLHYAAQHGLVKILQIIMERMQRWSQFEVSKDVDAPFWQDGDGLSPLHLSVMGRHYKTTKALLEAEDWRNEKDRVAAMKKHMGRSGEVLSIAATNGTADIAKLLIDAGVDINYQDAQGETALHVVARHGHSECAEILLQGSLTDQANLEIAEATFGWTPLFVACVDGQREVAQLMLKAGADTQVVDYSGWTPGEHASLRGHLKLAADLLEYQDIHENGGSSPGSASPSLGPSLGDRKSRSAPGARLTFSEPVKAFGHRYLKDHTMVLVSLGSMDMRKPVDVIQLDRVPLAEAHLTQLDTALSVVVSAQGAEGEPSIVDLPVQENISTEPIAFLTKDASKVKIMFDIVPTYAGSKEKIVGRGVALLGSVKPSLGSNRITLQGDISVPIMASHNLEVIGSASFNFLIVKPFKHPNISIAEGQTYWKSMSAPLVIGHRGLGKNQASRTSLQLGENTIQSFIAAANLGAQYVEFDVQLTKDHVPVIYHDFLVSETGIDAPVHSLTLEQFMHVSDGRTPRDSRPGSPLKGVEEDGKTLRNRKARSMSLGMRSDYEDGMSERMKHTRDFKSKGFKGNSRKFIQAPFTTLEEMFQKLPEHVGFNIEMKYPMLFESEDQEMDTYAVELNYFVDTVLTKIYDLNKGRNILISSFNPDICLLCSLKQPSIPILFLTDAGVDPVGDIRASSLQEAIRFASRWNLLGIVSAAEPFVLSPRLVQVVKESGLMCVSYGAQNNEPDKVKLQVQNGIDAVIVDSVLAIRKGLTEGEAEAAERPSAAEVAMDAAPSPPNSDTLEAMDITAGNAGGASPAAAAEAVVDEAAAGQHSPQGVPIRVS